MTLEPVHRKCCGDTVVRRTRARPPLGNSSAPRPAETFADFRETALPMLLALGPYAYSDPVLLYKVRWTDEYGAPLFPPNSKNQQESDSHNIQSEENTHES